MNQTTLDENELAPAPRGWVLLIDDDDRLRELLNQALQDWSFATSTAVTFRTAREAVLTGTPFTIVVCDYHLPDGNGLEFLDWLHREMLVELPFLLISGGIPRPATGVADYKFLAKPFRLQELRECLDRLSRVEQLTDRVFNRSRAQEALASVYARSRPRKDGGPDVPR